MATINTVFKLTDEMTSPLGRINNYLETTLTKMLSINVAINVFNTAVQAIKKAVSAVNELSEAYTDQYEQEVKLYTIMRQRMNGTMQDMTAMKNLASKLASENEGIYNDQMILQGMQEIATFVNTRKQIEDLIPAIANLTAQQYGYAASGDNVKQVATLVGRMISGNTSGLNKLNLQFTDAERKILQMKNVSTNIPIVLGAIERKVGDMNKALALTNEGKINYLRNQLQNVKEDFGRLVQPIQILGLQIKLAFQTKVLELFQRALRWVAENVDILSKAIVVFSITAISYLTAVGVAWMISHWQITLVIGAIVLLIYILTQCGISTEELLGYFVGGIKVVMAILRNLVVFFYNSVYVPIYNTIATLVEGVVTLFTQPLVFIKQFIGGIVNTILSLITPIMSVVDWLLGTDTLSALNKAIQDVYDWSEEGANFKIDRKLAVNYSNIEEAAQEGYDIGFKGGQALKDALKYASSMVDMEVSYPEVGTFDSNGALLVTDKNLIDIAEDYRELLSKRAVEKFNLQFSQITPSINVDHVDIHKEADAENVLSTIVDALDEVVNSSLSLK